MLEAAICGLVSGATRLPQLMGASCVNGLEFFGPRQHKESALLLLQPAAVTPFR